MTLFLQELITLLLPTINKKDYNNKMLKIDTNTYKIKIQLEKQQKVCVYFFLDGKIH